MPRLFRLEIFTTHVRLQAVTAAVVVFVAIATQSNRTANHEANTIATASETTNTMSSQQQQQQSKRKREPSASLSSSPATDESEPSPPQTKKAKVNDDKKIDDGQLPSCGCSNSHDQLEQQRAESKRECYICLEDFYDRTEEGIITACGHIFCLECLGFWRDWLQELGLGVRCPECRGLVENIDDWSFDPLLEDD